MKLNHSLLTCLYGNCLCPEEGSPIARMRPGEGGVLPYMGYIGTCRGIGYSF